MKQQYLNRLDSSSIHLPTTPDGTRSLSSNWNEVTELGELSGDKDGRPPACMRPCHQYNTIFLHYNCRQT